jgi:hypothetical protein
MIQPTFSKTAIAGLIGMMARVNAELLEKWRLAATQGGTVNVTQGRQRHVLKIILHVLKIILTAIFGDDYQAAAQHFSVLANEAAGNLELAQSFRRRSRIIIEIAGAKAARSYRGEGYPRTHDNGSRPRSWRAYARCATGERSHDPYRCRSRDTRKHVQLLWYLGIRKHWITEPRRVGGEFRHGLVVRRSRLARGPRRHGG